MSGPCPPSDEPRAPDSVAVALGLSEPGAWRFPLSAGSGVQTLCHLGFSSGSFSLSSFPQKQEAEVAPIPPTGLLSFTAPLTF